MTQIATSVSPKSLTQWLFNPFRFIAGFKALLLGLIIIALTSLLASLSDTHFDGTLDVHVGLQAAVMGMQLPLWLFLTEGLINWLSLALPLYFFGLILSRSSVRFIDVLGTQALARWPYLITALVMMPPSNKTVIQYLMSLAMQGPASDQLSYLDMTVFIFAMLATILMVVWMVTLMYRAYSICCNIKGAKAVITFIISLIGAEALSKLAIFAVFTRV
ncbi:MAG: hypothetical protein ACYS18_02050 [Planctomycetota bacterium]|jgi:hypothetical protein